MTFREAQSDSARVLGPHRLEAEPLSPREFVFMVIRKLEYLMALAREGHFARAAAACHVSQPALSAGIQQLELELGVSIVKRGQRFQGFTEQGEVVLAWANRLAVECERLHLELRDMSAKLSGTLRIGVLNSAIPLASILTLAFERKYPKIGLRVTAQNAHEIQQGLENFSLDVAITFLHDKLRRFSRTQLLYSHEYDLLIRRGANKLSGRESVGWEEIKQIPLCLLTEEIETLGSEVGQILAENQRGLPHIDTTSMYVLMDHVRTGKWASILPHTVQILIAGDNELEAIPLRRAGNAAPEVGIAIPQREPASHLAEAFFEVAISREVTKRLHDSMHSAHAAA
jgi:DNA-binding transcriptional LysR family regulator